MSRILLPLMFLLFLNGRRAECTTFVVVPLPGRILIGSDSLRTHHGQGSDEPVCKIRYADGTVILTAGLAESSFNGNQERLLDYVKETLALSTTVNEKASYLATKAKKFLETALQNNQQSGRQDSAELRAILSISAVVMKVTNGKNSFAGFDVDVASWSPPTVTLNESPFYLKQLRNGSRVPVGNSEGWVSVMKSLQVPRQSPKAFRNLAEPLTFIKAVLSRQIQASPWDTGPPLQIAELTEGNLKWIESGACDISKVVR